MMGSVYILKIMENVKTRYLLEYVVLKPFSIIFSTKKNNHNKTRRETWRGWYIYAKFPFAVICIVYSKLSISAFLFPGNAAGRWDSFGNYKSWRIATPLSSVR